MDAGMDTAGAHAPTGSQVAAQPKPHSSTQVQGPSPGGRALSANESGPDERDAMVEVGEAARDGTEPTQPVHQLQESSASRAASSTGAAMQWMQSLLNTRDVAQVLKDGGGAAEIVRILLDTGQRLETRGTAAYVLGQLAQALPQVHRFANSHGRVVSALMGLIADAAAAPSELSSVSSAPRGAWRTMPLPHSHTLTGAPHGTSISSTVATVSTPSELLRYVDVSAGAGGSTGQTAEATCTRQGQRRWACAARTHQRRTFCDAHVRAGTVGTEGSGASTRGSAVAFTIRRQSSAAGATCTPHSAPCDGWGASGARLAAAWSWRVTGSAAAPAATPQAPP